MPQVGYLTGDLDVHQVKKAQQELAERQVVLQTLFSKAVLVSNPFEALLKALQAAQQMKNLEKSASNDTRMQVMRGLQQAIYHVRERDRAVGHTSGIRSVAFSPDGKIFASAGLDNTIKLWKLELDLDKLIGRGCLWLEDYFASHPEEAKKFSKICK